MNDKTCTKCKEVKSIAEFREDIRYADGFKNWCNSCAKIYRHDYYSKHKTKCAEQQRKYIKANAEKRRKTTRNYNQKNRDKFKVWKAIWRAKVKDDPVYRLGHTISNGMRHSLIGKKNGRHWETLVGYTAEDLIQHITKLLTNGMTWENYGSYWHLDHITPKSWFKCKSSDDPQFKQCWALSNLQPMRAIDNMRKRNYWAG